MTIAALEELVQESVAEAFAALAKAKTRKTGGGTSMTKKEQISRARKTAAALRTKLDAVDAALSSLEDSGGGPTNEKVSKGDDFFSRYVYGTEIDEAPNVSSLFK